MGRTIFSLGHEAKILYPEFDINGKPIARTPAMRTYRMEQTATVCFDVQAESEAEAITKAEKAAEDFSFGFELPDGIGYSNAVLYTSEEESADVMDIDDPEADALTRADERMAAEDDCKTPPAMEDPITDPEIIL